MPNNIKQLVKNLNSMSLNARGSTAQGTTAQGTTSRNVNNLTRSLNRMMVRIPSHGNMGKRVKVERGINRGFLGTIVGHSFHPNNQKHYFSIQLDVRPQTQPSRIKSENVKFI